MNKSILILLLVVSFTASCQNDIAKKQIQENYKKSIQFFNDDLVNHFPSNLSDSSGYHTNVLRKYNLANFCFDVSKILLWKQYNAEQYLILKNQYDSLASKIYYSSDTSLLLIFSYCDSLEVEGKIYKDQESLERRKLAKHNVTNATSTPIPLFEIEEYKGQTACGLQSDFRLVVLEAKNGVYLDEKYLQDCSCLPKIWQHGYSKGVALNDETHSIIYWIMVW